MDFLHVVPQIPSPFEAILAYFAHNLLLFSPSPACLGLHHEASIGHHDSVEPLCVLGQAAVIGECASTDFTRHLPLVPGHFPTLPLVILKFSHTGQSLGT